MAFSRREEKRLRELIKLGTFDAIKEFKKDIQLECMTRADCLSIHQGRYTPQAVQGNNGDLKRQKIKFWGVLVGLILAITSLLTTISAILITTYLN